jgi:hypothetical protein
MKNLWLILFSLFAVSISSSTLFEEAHAENGLVTPDLIQMTNILHPLVVDDLVYLQTHLKSFFYHFLF